MDIIFLITIIIVSIIWINYQLIRKIYLRFRDENTIKKILARLLYYIFILFISFFLYLLILYWVTNIFWDKSSIWIWIYPLILLFYWVKQKKKNIEDFTIINNTLLVTNWLLVFSVFIKCYTYKWEISEVYLLGFLGIILYWILATIINILLKKWSWLYYVLAIFISIHIYLSWNWYIFNITHYE